MLLEAEKRFSPRITTKSSLKFSPSNRQGEVLNISESGLCFECEDSNFSDDLSLAMFPSPFEIQDTQVSAKIIWKTLLPNNKYQYGIKFSFSDKEQLTPVRNFVFDAIAKKATSLIQNANNGVKSEVENFFNKDVKMFHEEMTKLYERIQKGNVEDAEKKVTTLINDLLLRGYALEKMIENETDIKEIKKIFRESVNFWCFKSPILKMAYDKPQGYPGDYKLFEIIYDKKPLAKNETLGFYWDNYFLNNGYAQAARARKNKMKNILQDFIENTDMDIVKFLNVACGPSREIRELFSDSYLSTRKKVVFTGLDHDQDSLNFSQSKLNSFPANIQVRLLAENVLNIFRDDKYYEIIGKQDVIYILGLTEYLPDRIFRRLTRFLFNLLNDKGMLVITYKDEALPLPSLPPDWLCDWAFIKRSQEDLIKTAKEIGSNQYSLKIEREGTGSIFFFILTKT